MDLVRRLRTPGRTPCPHVKILVLTPNISEAEVGAWIKVGADYLCGWPTSTAMVLSRLAVLVSRPVVKIAVPTYIGPCRRRSPLTAFNGPNRRKPRPPRR